MVLATDWKRFVEGTPGDLVKGGVALSGLYALEPIRLTYLNDALKMDTETAARNSPVLHPPTGAAPLVVAYGGDESEEYHRQAADLVEKLAQNEVPHELIEAPGLNHYSIIEQFLDPKTPLAQAAKRQMGL